MKRQARSFEKNCLFVYLYWCGSSSVDIAKWPCQSPAGIRTQPSAHDTCNMSYERPTRRFATSTHSSPTQSAFERADLWNWVSTGQQPFFFRSKQSAPYSRGYGGWVYWYWLTPTLHAVACLPPAPACPHWRSPHLNTLVAHSSRLAIRATAEWSWYGLKTEQLGSGLGAIADDVYQTNVSHLEHRLHSLSHYFQRMCGDQQPMWLFGWRHKTVRVSEMLKHSTNKDRFVLQRNVCHNWRRYSTQLIVNGCFPQVVVAIS